jgi:hypothetical protein
MTLLSLFQKPVGFSRALAVFQARALQNRAFLRLLFQNQSFETVSIVNYF